MADSKRNYPVIKMNEYSGRDSVLSNELPEYLFEDSSDCESEMGTVVEDSFPDRIFVHQLNVTSADILRRQKEKEMVEEEKRKVTEGKEIKMRQKEEEKKRDREMLLAYNPWGKPGAGAIGEGEDPKRRRYPEGRTLDTKTDEDEPTKGLMLQFGRPGHGAPNRTESGRIRTQIQGDPSIRFQDTQHVRLSIENQLRYKNEDKENYRGNLDELVQQKLHIQEKEKEFENKKFEEMKELYPFGRGLKNDPMFMATIPKRIVRKDDFDPWGKGFGNPSWDSQGNVYRHKFTTSAEEGIQESHTTSSGFMGMRRNRDSSNATENGNQRTKFNNPLLNAKTIGVQVNDEQQELYNPWGKPGGGAPFVREDEKPFEEKMGWSLTGHPKKRSRDAKQEYMNALQNEMEERRKKDQKERIFIREPIVRIRPPHRMSNGKSGTELASIIRRGVGGRPRKDPTTGELLPNPRQLTDVTQERLDIRRAKSQESLLYFNELSEQAAQRQLRRQEQKQLERAQSEKHVSTWETFWGRPGHGAPRDSDNHKKENLVQLLESDPAKPYVKHYITECVPSKHKNGYEFATKDVITVKKEYAFKTPFPAMEA